jgi:trehalose 6-phosphate phosphatase
VDRPELARPLPEVPLLLEALAARYALVAVVSGRTGHEVRRLLPVEGIEVFGLYGLEGIGAPVHGPGVEAVREEVERIAALVPGAWVEDKGMSLAVHYRQARSPDEAPGRLAPPLEALARDRGLAVLPGKMVLELAPLEVPGKGSVITEQCRARGLRAALHAGDDAADLEAFAALERLREDGVFAVKVAVRSMETPPDLLAGADVVVDGPAGLLSLLRALAA